MGIWRNNFRVTSFSVDAKRKITIPTICNFLQDSANNHAINRKIGVDNLLKKNQMWVLSRMKMEIEKYPKWRDELSVETWVKETERVFAFRDFQIYNEIGERMIAATTSWAVVDVERRRLQSLEYFKEHTEILDRFALEELAAKLPTVKNADWVSKHIVIYDDIDMNQHANNVKYIEWSLSAFPISLRKEFYIKIIEINYLAELYLGDEVEILYKRDEKNPLLFTSSMKRISDGKEICRVRTTWKKE